LHNPSPHLNPAPGIHAAASGVHCRLKLGNFNLATHFLLRTPQILKDEQYAIIEFLNQVLAKLTQYEI